ncbi:endonuclease domain-containing protein [Legionella worsleiensis]|nr:endonuclease domain-containing protein [Legionella worsleiensis]
MNNRAKALRQTMTDAENRMWYYLRNRRLSGYKFIRQHVIGNYIVDFVCREKKLIVEIDGSQHMDAVDYDLRRSQYLERRGYRVVRIWNHDVFKNIQGVMDSVLNELETVPQASPHPQPFSPEGEGSELSAN